jgi:hypothetical protein
MGMMEKKNCGNGPESNSNNKNNKNKNKNKNNRELTERDCEKPR